VNRADEGEVELKTPFPGNQSPASKRKDVDLSSLLIKEKACFLAIKKFSGFELINA
jgi:hypothetical protein